MTPAKRVVRCLTYNHPGVLEEVRSEESGPNVKILLRVFNEDAWMNIMVDLIEAMDRIPTASQFVGKSYWLAKGELVYGWIVCLYGKESTDDFVPPLEVAFGMPAAPTPRERQVGSPALAEVPIRAPARPGAPVPQATSTSSARVVDTSERRQGRVISHQRILGKATLGFNSETRKGAYELEPRGRNKGVNPLHGGRG